jgi:hypothetical protein
LAYWLVTTAKFIELYHTSERNIVATTYYHCPVLDHVGRRWWQWWQSRYECFFVVVFFILSIDGFSVLLAYLDVLCICANVSRTPTKCTASVKVIRGLATGSIHDGNLHRTIRHEIAMGMALSILLGVAGAIRAALFAVPLMETLAITVSLGKYIKAACHVNCCHAAHTRGLPAFFFFYFPNTQFALSSCRSSWVPSCHWSCARLVLIQRIVPPPSKSSWTFWGLLLPFVRILFAFVCVCQKVILLFLILPNHHPVRRVRNVAGLGVWIVACQLVGWW